MSTPGQQRTIVLVEDHPAIRLGLRSVLEAQADLKVVAEARSSEEALALVTQYRPDLVVLPLRLEGELRGVELCRELVSLAHAPKVLIYSAYNSPDDASASFLSGAHSFVHKGEETGRLLETIRATLDGRRVWLLGTEPNDSVAQLEQHIEKSRLTSRESEVLGFMLQRFTNAQIANELFIELPTVKTHVRSILSKLGISSRRELF